MKLIALALTAGLGTRLRPHTNIRAKPAIPFLGVPLGLHALRHLEVLKPDELFLNLHYRPQDIRSLELDHLDLPSPRYSDESSGILGSGGAPHAVCDANPADHYLVCNGDEVLFPEDKNFLKAAFDQHLQRNNLATLVTMEHPEVGHGFGGAWTTNSSQQVKVFSKKSVPGLTGHHYVGYLFLKGNIHRYFKSSLVEENILYDTLTAGINAGESVECFQIKTQWYETGEIQRFVESSHQALDFIEDNMARAEVRDFLGFLSRFSSYQFLIEKEDSSLASRLQAFLRKSLLKAP